MRTLKDGSCLSLSGGSELSYCIISDDSKQLHLQITNNSGKGLYLKTPILLSQVLPIDDKAFSSGIYQQLFRGGSVNTAGFLLAILKHLGLVQNVEGSIRKYILSDQSAFNAEMQALMDTDPPKPAKTKKVSAKESPCGGQ